MELSVIRERLDQLRRMMAAHGWDAVILTGTDPHRSEYSAPRYHAVEWASGYTGEGDLVVTADHAGLWTDSRYFIQANAQLEGTGVLLHKTRVPDEVPVPQWLARHFAGGGETVVAVDGRCISATEVTTLRTAFGVEDALTVVSIPDLLQPLWTDRPAVPQTPVITLGAELAGWSRTQKLSWLRRWLSEGGFDGILLSALDEIAWLLNVRGEDIAYNPLVISYLLVTPTDCLWFVRKGPLPPEDHETEDSFYELTADGVSIQDYDEIGLVLSGMLDGEFIHRLFVDASTLNYDLYQLLKESAPRCEIEAGRTPVGLRKAVKNEIEIAQMREAHLEDGLAMVQFLFWLEQSLAAGESIDEYEAACYLHDCRSRIPGFRGESFETISAYGPSAALPHYVTPETGSRVLFPQGLYLCDSGGQYIFGTTDITRTVPLGPCTQLEKEDYTLVLKGHIDLAKAVFPRGTAGCQLDALARAPLWASLRNFGHGTGHGVGFFLGVHEGPQDIRQNFNRQPLLAGMITSDEPGIYREGRHGVRHENLLLTVDAGTNEFGAWSRFEPLTLCPFDTSALLVGLLDESEIAWLNAYHKRVYEKLSPRLSGPAARWLRDKTAPVTR